MVFTTDPEPPTSRANRPDGCVTNFNHGEQRLTIWKSGERFRLEEYGAGGAILPMTYDELFQSIAAEVHRLACEVGSLRRELIDLERKAERAVEGEGRRAFDAGVSQGWNSAYRRE